MTPSTEKEVPLHDQIKSITSIKVNDQEGAQNLLQLSNAEVVKLARPASISPKKAQRKSTGKFMPEKLRSMIADGHLQFCPNGQDIRVVNPKVFYERIMNNYMRGTGRAAFRKQLNLYRFFQVLPKVYQHEYEEVYWAKGFTREATDYTLFGLNMDVSSSVTEEEAARLYGKGPFRQKRSITSSSEALQTVKRQKTVPKFECPNTPPLIPTDPVTVTRNIKNDSSTSLLYKQLSRLVHEHGRYTLQTILEDVLAVYKC